eukprot:4211837-Pyramimonas_sp.AAC.1
MPRGRLQRLLHLAARHPGVQLPPPRARPPREPGRADPRRVGSLETGVNANGFSARAPDLEDPAGPGSH